MATHNLMHNRCTFDNVLVRILGENISSTGGLFLPDDVREKTMLRGEVLDAGPGDGCPLLVKKGDTVLVPRRTGTAFKNQEGIPLLLIKEKEIMAILE